jgi:hypothetical protein
LGSTVAGTVVTFVCTGPIPVTDCTVVPLEGALVAIQGTNIAAASDAAGFYELQGVPGGFWTVAVLVPSPVQPGGCLSWAIVPNVAVSGDPLEIVGLLPIRPQSSGSSCSDHGALLP